MTSNLLNAPLDIFDCIIDHCSLKTLRNFALTCKAVATHRSLNKGITRKSLERKYQPNYLFELLCKQNPGGLSSSDRAKFVTLHPDLTRRARDLARFRTLHPVFNDSNKSYIRKISVSQWATLEYFQSIDVGFPNLVSLDLGDMMHTYFGEGFSWKELAETCPALFGRLECLTFGHLGGYDKRTALWREYPWWSPERSGGTLPPPKSRSNEDGNYLESLLKACSKLKTLRIIEPRKLAPTESLYLEATTSIQAIASYAPASLERLDLDCFDFPVTAKPIRGKSWYSLRNYLSPLAQLPRLRIVGLRIGSFLRQVSSYEVDSYLMPEPSFPGSTDEDHTEEYEDHTDKEYTYHDHHYHGYLHEILRDLKAVIDEGWFKIASLDSIHGIVYSSRDLVELLNPKDTRGMQFDPQDTRGAEAMQWFSATYNWQPVIKFDPHIWTTKMMFGRKTNHGPSLETIKATFEQMRKLSVPVILRIRYTPSRSSLALDVVESIAGSVDELEIHAHCLTQKSSLNDDSDSDWDEDSESTLDMDSGSTRARQDWTRRIYDRKGGATELRRFWRMFPESFINVRKIDISVPKEMYDSWWTGLQPLPLAAPVWREIVYSDRPDFEGKTAPRLIRQTLIRDI